MKGEFEMSMMGELSFFLGLQVKQTKDGIFLCQSKYCKEILNKFEMESCKEASTPIPSSCYMDADAARKGVDQTKYRGLIGSLLYLTASRPDIMFTVCLCARYQANPKESHFKVAKRILKYLKGISTVGLWYPSHSPIHLIGYSDSDFAGCKISCFWFNQIQHKQPWICLHQIGGDCWIKCVQALKNPNPLSLMEGWMCLLLLRCFRIGSGVDNLC